MPQTGRPQVLGSNCWGLYIYSYDAVERLVKCICCWIMGAFNCSRVYCSFPTPFGLILSPLISNPVYLRLAFIDGFLDRILCQLLQKLSMCLRFVVVLFF